MDNLTIDNPDHEMICIRQDKSTGLKAVIAVHDRTLGPAIGGCRMLPYPSLGNAVADALRLAKGMTYKCAIAGIPYGGGKAAVIADPRTEKSRELLLAIADFVDSLGGTYITSFDSGTTLDDLHVMGERTSHVAGYAPDFGNAADSTAIGVLHCMQEAWLNMTGQSLEGVTVAIQGVGSVGSRLASLLLAKGAKLVVADSDSSLTSQIDAVVAQPGDIHRTQADIFAPCALGGVLNHRTIPEIRARLIVGAANNQLEQREDAIALAERGILYCPDYLVNAGGIVELHHQRSTCSHHALAAHLKSLAGTLREVLIAASESGRTPLDEADTLVEARLAAARS
jgi:leucine dehydrogenase